METKNILALCIARLELELDARDSGFDLAVPLIYEKFLKNNLSFRPAHGTGEGILSLFLHNDPQPMEERSGLPICITEIWELWLDENGYYVFTSPRQTPPKRVTIDPSFRTGEIVADFSLIKDQGIYPLSSIDIRIMVTWLASFGDLILHASGVSVNGQGYCFLGESGAGKSTLVSALAKDHSVTILGEDQIILRYLDGQFWIYGTPWHERVEMCSQIGVPLKKMFFLSRDVEAGIEPVSPSEGISRILQTAFVPYYLPEKLPGIIERLTLLSKELPFFCLSYKLGSDILPSIIG